MYLSYKGELSRVHELHERIQYGSCMPQPKHWGLSDAIQAKVRDRGKSMALVSMELGLTPNALSRWNTYIEPRAEFYTTLMDFLGVKLEELGALIVVDQMRRAGLPLP